MLVLRRVLFFVLPTLVFIAASFGVNPLVRKIEMPFPRLLAFTLWGIALFLLLMFTVRRLAEWAKIPRAPVGSLRALLPGIALGIAVSFVSGALFALTHGTGFSAGQFAGRLYPNVISQIPHALTEEADFRLGIVGGAVALAGENVALAAGSIPFGLLHLIDRFYGVPVDFSQVIGIILAGLMLSALYLRFGLWAAIGAHYGWNWLSPAWSRALRLPDESGINQLEGAPTTSLVLFLVVAALLWHARKRRA
jgi:hypothetical protein